MAAAAIGLRDLGALAAVPGVEVSSPFDEQPYVLVNLEESAADRSVAVDPAVVHWLRRQPCPVIAIDAAGAHDDLRRACDVVVARTADLEPVLRNVCDSPLAAMVLVQVLRASEPLPVEQALVVESLAFATLQGGPEFRRWLAGRSPPRATRDADAGPPVEVERHADGVEVRLNRPSRRNALSVEMRDALCEALDFVAADPMVRMARISGNGRCFCSGGDLEEFGMAPDPSTGHAVRSLRLPARVLLQCIDRVEFRLHGACVGAGAELPAFGRRVCARPDTYFQLPEIRLGLIPGAGGCVSIPRRIGRQRAAYMALSAARIDAQQALSWGLVDAIVD